MEKKAKLVFGLGIKGEKHPSYEGAKPLREYTTWVNMLRRCTEKLWSKHPTYTGTTCSESFKDYDYFYEWCQNQVGFGNTDDDNISWHLDKDILVKGNKHYSEDTCVFVPHKINSLLCRRRGARGEYLIGVTLEKRTNRFMSRCNRGEGVMQHLGRFESQGEAFRAYKTYKESIIKKAAEEYKIKIDPRTYEALMKYEVSEND